VVCMTDSTAQAFPDSVKPIYQFWKKHRDQKESGHLEVEVNMWLLPHWTPVPIAKRVARRGKGTGRHDFIRRLHRTQIQQVGATLDLTQDSSRWVQIQSSLRFRVQLTRLFSEVLG
jgi:hypothetical protein